MIDFIYISLLLVVLFVTVHRGKHDFLSAITYCCAFGVVGVSLADVLGHGFTHFRLLDRFVFWLLPFALVVIGKKRLADGWHRRLVTVIAPILLVSLGIWCHWLEPRWLEVREVTLHSHRIRQPVTVAVLADLQTDRIGAHERRAIRALMAPEPDLILLTGDYLQARASELSRLGKELRQLFREEAVAAPLGVHAVRGDVEPDGWTQLFDGLGIQTYPHSTTFERGELTITALSAVDSRSGKAVVPNSRRFQIVFGHAPDFALQNINAELQVAGHTHGGQVRLPFLGPLVTYSQVPRAWAAGVTDLGVGRTLVVSRGVGMERGAAPRLRFLCRPEIVIIRLLPENDLRTSNSATAVSEATSSATS